jgi:hypothetical protein
MTRARLRLVLGDGAYGPGDVEPFRVDIVGMIPGSDLPDWNHEALLAICEKPFDWHGEIVEYVVISPRYTQDSISSIALRGGGVGLGRVRPGHDPTKWARLDPFAIHYWAVAVATVEAPAEVENRNAT